MLLQGLADRHYLNTLFSHGTVNRGIVHLDKSPDSLTRVVQHQTGFQHFTLGAGDSSEGLSGRMFFRRPGELGQVDIFAHGGLFVDGSLRLLFAAPDELLFTDILTAPENTFGTFFITLFFDFF